MNVELNEGRRGIAGKETDATKATSSWFYWVLGIVILIGVGLRMAHIDHRTYNPDEQIAQAVVKNLNFPRQWDTNWAKTEVIESFRYDQYNFSSYHYLLYFWQVLCSWFGLDGIGQLWVLRMFNGLFGGIFLGAIAFAARQYAGALAGIAAAAAGAVMPLLIQDAHYVRCEAMLTAGVAVMLWLAGRRGVKHRWLFFFCGLLAGWMVAGKVTMVVALPLLAPLLFPAIGWKIPANKPVLVLGGLVVLGVVLGIFFGMPWAVAQPHLYFSGLARISTQYHASMPPYSQPDLAPSYLVTLAYLKGTLGWGFWAVAFIGVWHLLKGSERGRAVLMLVTVAVAFYVFGSHPYFSERSFSPFLPVAAVFFGVGCQSIIQIAVGQSPLPRFWRSFGILALVLSLTLAWPTLCSWRIVFLGFSGKEMAGQLAFVDRMRTESTARIVLVVGSEFGAKDRAEIEKAAANKEPLLLIVGDDCDAYTRRCLAILQSQYHGQILGVRESLFPDLPPCTLHTFISPRLWGIAIPAK